MTDNSSTPNICINCRSEILPKLFNGKPTSRSLWESKIKKFCNRNCSATYNNKKRANPPKLCPICGKHIKRNSDRCKRCNSENNCMDSNTTKGEIFSSSKTYSSARSMIRIISHRVFMKSNKPKSCLVCGYNKYIEVCHVTPVSDFPDRATIGEISNIDNLVGLCPNHHWEFDHGVVDIHGPVSPTVL